MSIEFSNVFRRQYGASLPAIGMCSVLAFLIGSFIYRDFSQIHTILEFSDRRSILLFLAVAVEIFLLFYIYKLSTVEVTINESSLSFSQLNNEEIVNLKDILSYRKRGAVIFLHTKEGEKRVPHFGVFGEFLLVKELESMGIKQS